jgi:hypothetical protein
MAARTFFLCLMLHLAGAVAPRTASALAERFAAPFHGYFSGNTGAVTADFNRDGRLDVVTIGTSDLVGGAWILYGAANATFTPPNPITSSLDWPSAVAAADMDGDGLLDLVVTRIAAGIYSPGVQIVLNKGTTWTTLPPSPVTSDPIDVATADLNHDGAVDVVTANHSGNNLSVLLGNGNGTLRAPVDYATGTEPKSLAIGDLNSDGHADVVTANSTGTGVTIWYGTGTGTLTSRNDVATVAVEPWAVVIGRFNADAIPDIATVHPIEAKISILLGLGGTSYAAPTPVTPAFGQDLVASDFNSDGKTDLAFIAGPTGGVFLGTGTGTFGAPASFKAGDGGAAFMTGKLHGDSNPDILVQGQFGVLSVLTGNGDGKFGTDKETSAGSTPYAVVVGDVTGDGRPDAVVSDQYAPAILVIPGDATWTSPGPPTSYAAVGGPVTSLALSDVDGDGDLDVVAGLQKAPPSNVQVFYNNGSGAFSTSATYSAPGSNPRAVAARDCNGDNRPDLFVANGSSGSFSVFLNDGFGGFLAPATYSVAFSEIVSIVATNIVGTSAQDLVLADHGGNRVLIYSGNGAGAFSLSKTLNAPPSPTSVSTGDLSGDGLLDIAVACDNSNEVGIFINSVSNTFTNTDNIFAGYFGLNPPSLVGSDLDGDGMRDLVVSNPALNTITFLRRTSSTPTFGPPEPLGVGFGPAGIAVADLDGDADQDILVANSLQPSLQILKNSTPVAPPDLAPSVLTIPSVNVEATGTLTFSVTASDGNADAISTLAAAPLPTGAVFTPDISHTSGVFTWTPTSDQVGSYTVTFTASNALPGSASTQIHVHPYGTRANGTFLWVPQTADIGMHVIRFRAANAAGDPAATESTVVTVSAPSAMAPVRLAGHVILSPKSPMKGPIVSVTPTYGATAGDTVAIDVSATDTDTLTANTTGTSSDPTFSNDFEPIVYAPPHVNAPRGVPLSFVVTVSDPDGDPIASLTANLSSLPPGNATFTPGAGNTSGTFTWTPAMTDSGTFGVTFIATNQLVGVGGTQIHVDPVGPVSYWKLNGSGRDEIGKVPLGPVGTPAYGAAKFNQGAILDGTGLNGLGAIATPDHTIPLGSWTVECWVNAGATQAQDKVILAANDNPGDNYWTIGVTALGKAWFQMYADGSFTTDMRSTTTITGGAYHHIAFTTNGTTMTLYVDGVVQTTATAMAACTVAGGTIALGAGVSPYLFRSGTVDEIRIWNMTRTQAQILASMNSELTGYATAVEGPVPPVYRNVLRQNAPNPFNPRTEIAFELARGGRTTLRVYDIQGRLVATLLDGALPAGPHRVSWSSHDRSGREVASGVYFYRLDTPGFKKTKRMTLAR